MLRLANTTKPSDVTDTKGDRPRAICMYKTIRRNLARIASSALPLDLYVFPTMLAMLIVLPPLFASALSLVCLVGTLYLSQCRDKWAEHRQALLIASVWVVLFALLTLGFDISDDVLERQLVWLALGALYGLYISISQRHSLREPVGRCGSARLLFGIYRQCYMRFARVLLLFSLALGSVICLLLYIHAPLWCAYAVASVGGLGALGVLSLDLTHLGWVQTRQGRDFWIPVLNDEQTPIGRVPSIEPRTCSGRLPLVRLMAFSRGMIYLEQCQQSSEIHYDTPFYAWLREGQTPTESAQTMIDSRFCGVRRAQPRSLLHYHTERNDGQALSVYFFAVELDAPDLLLVDCKPIEGKWWTLSQVVPMLGGNAFCHYLRSELPYLEQTALLAQQLRGRTKDNV